MQFLKRYGAVPKYFWAIHSVHLIYWISITSQPQESAAIELSNKVCFTKLFQFWTSVFKIRPRILLGKSANNHAQIVMPTASKSRMLLVSANLWADQCKLGKGGELQIHFRPRRPFIGVLGYDSRKFWKLGSRKIVLQRIKRYLEMFALLKKRIIKRNPNW